jgi:hypothetical protein
MPIDNALAKHQGNGQFVLRPTQLRKKHCFVKSTSNDLTAVEIKFFPPERTDQFTSDWRISLSPTAD